MSMLLEITPIKANTNNSNLSSDHTACPTHRSSSGKITVPMLALSTVRKLNYADNLQLHAQYIKSLTSSPVAIKTNLSSAPRDHAQRIRTPEKVNNVQTVSLNGNTSENNNLVRNGNIINNNIEGNTTSQKVFSFNNTLPNNNHDINNNSNSNNNNKGKDE